jgi:hypothetical protein
MEPQVQQLAEVFARTVANDRVSQWAWWAVPWMPRAPPTLAAGRAGRDQAGRGAAQGRLPPAGIRHIGAQGARSLRGPRRRERLGGGRSDAPGRGARAAPRARESARGSADSFWRPRPRPAARQVVAAGDALGLDIRLAAAVNFKNLVKYRWVRPARAAF